MTAVIPSAARGADDARMPTVPPAPDPFGAFRRDHAMVLSQLDALESRTLTGAGLGDERLLGAAVELLERQFATHMAAEDAVLYPAVQAAFPTSRSTLEALRADHVELRWMLTTISSRLGAPASPGRDEQLPVVLRDFIDLLRLHIHREETVVFDVASRVLSDHEAQELARRIAPSRELPAPGRQEPGPTKGTVS